MVLYRDTSSRKIWCNSPNRSRRYKLKTKVHQILANFRIAFVKKCCGQTHPSEVCISKRWSSSLYQLPHFENFRGQRRLAAEIWASEKLILNGLKKVPFSPFVDHSSPNLAFLYCRGVIAVSNAVFRSTVSSSRPEIFAIKSQNGVVGNYVFGSKILGEKDPQYQMRPFYPLWGHIK